MNKINVEIKELNKSHEKIHAQNKEKNIEENNNLDFQLPDVLDVLNSVKPSLL